MSTRQERFRRLYAEQFDPLLGYALRRVDRAEDAADVAADTFLVAWRRLDDVPEGHEARLWLYGVARRTLANQRRGEGRRGALGERLRRDLATSVPDHAHAVSERETLRAALHRLADRDREVLELAAWEELEPREIAEVLGISAIAVRSRLSRSRARLRALVQEGGNDPGPPGHVPSRHPQLAREEDR
jgi:RNA polymerase sigma-70 factor (ECF subfamily)